MLNLTEEFLFFDNYEQSFDLDEEEALGEHFGLLDACSVQKISRHPSSIALPRIFFHEYTISGRYAFLCTTMINNNEYDMIFPDLAQIDLRGQKNE